MLPILISIPHASNFVPKNIRKMMKLTDKQIASYSDLYTDEIYDLHNCYQVKAHASRLVVDPNRAPDDIITESRLAHEGAVVQIAEDGRVIYKKGSLPTEKQMADRVETYHDNFHRRLEELKSKCKFLLDAHSYKNFGPITKPDAEKERPDICLGNRGYTTCSRQHTNFFFNFFKGLGYSVKVNDPYDGNYILGYHCHRTLFPGIQLEIKESLYMNDKTLRPRKKHVAELNEQVGQVVKEFCERFFPKKRFWGIPTFSQVFL